MRTAACFSLVVLLAASVPAAEGDAKSSDSWRSLPLVEDGKIADGWEHVGYGGFEVVDGALRTVGDERGLGVLVYVKETFGDCHLRVVFRTEKPQSNAGVHVRIGEGVLDAPPAPPAERNPDGSLTEAGLAAMKKASETHAGPWYAVHHGYEVQICDAADPYHRTGAVYSLAKAEPAPQKPPGTWRTMVVTLRGDDVLVEVDGKRVSEFVPGSTSVPERKEWHEPEREPQRPRSGYIALQNHDPGDVVDFKEVSVQPLEKGR